MKKSILAAFAVISYLASFGQVTQPNNTPVFGNFVGFNNNSGIALPIRNDGDPRINISSNGSNKFAITELATWPGLNGLTRNNVQRTTMGLQGQTNLAWSMLHLWDDAANALPGAMQRQWMNVGTSYTANVDFMYTGLLERPNTGGSNLATDAVIAWGCQPGTIQNGNTDNFRFLFLQGVSPNPNGGAQTQQGLEMMRISPVGNVGIGDFSSNGFGLAIQPTHRLDVDGNARFRQLTNLAPNVLFTGVQQDAVGDYELNYLAFPNNASVFLDGTGNWTSAASQDCRWFDATSVTVSNERDIYTGFDPAEDCNRGKLGVGTNQLRTAKIEGHNLTSRDSIFVGIYGNTLVDDDIYPLGTPGLDRRYTGIFGECVGLPQPTVGITTFGVRGKSNVGKYVMGVYGEAFQDVNFSTTHTMGVRAEATHSDTYFAVNVAVYAEVKPDPNTLNFGPGDRALITVGASTAVGTQIIISDENVKTDIAPLENAAEILQQLNPVTYIFESPENRILPFSQNLQYGLIAQDVQEVMPEVVYSNTIPEAMDSLGIVEGSGLELLGIDYNSFIPILIQGFKEQNVQLQAQGLALEEQLEENDSLQSEIAALSQKLDNQENEISEMKQQMHALMASFQSTQSKMNNCCGNAPIEKGHSETGALELEQNFPNPFDVETTINFTIHELAQIRLEISDASGRVLDVLVNTQLSEGRYTERWNASAYASGTYYYSLYANTELLTKKMIKR